LGLVRRRLPRQAARVLVFVLDEHRELPVLTWTVTPDVLQAHADVCDLDLVVTGGSSTRGRRRCRPARVVIQRRSSTMRV
jgi:hypothetical protein